MRKDYPPPDSLIERLCGNKRRVSTTSDGQSRYFGPTSSLHLTETPSSITSYVQFPSQDIDVARGVPDPLQHQLLELYWQYQHPILHFVHKEAFLSCMETGRGPYYSKCLLLCILASAARLSPDPQIRNLSLPPEDDDRHDRPPLMKQAEEALEREITNPSVTTIQSLCLLSIMYCIQSNDSKGWMLSGMWRDTHTSNALTNARQCLSTCLRSWIASRLDIPLNDETFARRCGCPTNSVLGMLQLGQVCLGRVSLRCGV